MIIQNHTHTFVYEVKYRNGDMAFEKTLLSAGSGLYRPNKRAKVVVDLIGKWDTSDGDDVTFDRREKVTIELGEKLVLFFEDSTLILLLLLDQANELLSETVEEMICRMKLGETARFSLHHAHKLLSNSPSMSNAKLPEMGAEVSYTIYLHSFEQGKDVWKLTELERLDIAKKHKEEGTTLFKDNQLYGAAIRYSKAFQYLAAVDVDILLEVTSLEDYEKEILSLRSMAMLNLAACQLKLKQYDHVVKNCNHVLALEPSNVKALYRKAKGLLGMKDFEEARECALKAHELEPSNRVLEELCRTVETQAAVYRAEYGKALRGMFS